MTLVRRHVFGASSGKRVRALSRTFDADLRRTYFEKIKLKKATTVGLGKIKLKNVELSL